MRDLVWIPFCLFMLEMFVALGAPGLLGRLARFRVGGTRSVSLPPHVARALERPIGTGGGYREAPAHAIDFAQLLQAKVVTKKEKLFFLRERGEILAQKTFDFVRKARPIVVVGLRAESDRIVLEPRFYPSQLVPMAAVAIFAAMVVKSVIPIPFFAAFYLIPFFMDRHAARALVDCVEAEVTSRVRLLASEPARVRYEQRAPGDEVEDERGAEAEEARSAGERR